ncbi:MAG: zf-HC2 domain-containing protein [Longimicrobiales bacterium]
MQQKQVAGDRLTCGEFLDSHTDYVDGALPEQVARRFDGHASECGACGRYDHVVRRGLLLARNLPEIQPSAHFHERLQARLMHLEAEPVRRPIMASSATVIMIAAVLAVIVITPLARPLEQETAGPAVDSAPAATLPPMLLPSLEEAPFAEPASTAVTASLLVHTIEPATFTPVVVSPPAVQTTATAPRLISYPLLQTLSR